MYINTVAINRICLLIFIMCIRNHL